MGVALASAQLIILLCLFFLILISTLFLYLHFFFIIKICTMFTEEQGTNSIQGPGDYKPGDPGT